jgi:uncharacterized membrane protein YeiH
MSTLYVLETIGVISFALSGMMMAKSHNFDPVGWFVIAWVTSFGGGTVRDLILDITPVYWIQHWEYPLIILILSLLLYFLKRVHIKEEWLIVPDALGLGLFTVTGVQLALSVGLPLTIVPIIGVITATFGGLIRDIICHHVPMLFQKVSFYGVTSYLGGCLYVALMYTSLDTVSSSVASVAFIFGFRLLSYHYNWRFR